MFLMARSDIWRVWRMTTDSNDIVVGTIVKRPWGQYLLVNHHKDYSVKVIYIAPGEETSLQRHSKRHELITLLDGTVKITHGDWTFTKDRSQRAASYRILAGEWHRFGAPADQEGYTVLLEVAYGELDPDDFQRSEDKYGRERKMGPGFVQQIMDNHDWRKG
jgi:mannose-6-phosphate isomerase-like protein (cupin superfamily)